jgi:DNA-binding MarR family transcriptional regulator
LEQEQTLTTISQIHYLQDRILTELLAKHQRPHVNAGQARLLMSLWEKDGINVQELADRTCLKKTTLSTMLPRLIEDGLITMTTDASDHRARLIHLTESARSLRREHQNLYSFLDEVFFSAVDPSDKEIFLKVLEQAKLNLLRRENQK